MKAKPDITEIWLVVALIVTTVAYALGASLMMAGVI
jgi:hypothetical protein